MFHFRENSGTENSLANKDLYFGLIKGKRMLNEDSITKLIKVRSEHPIQVKKTRDKFDEVFDYMVKVENMSEEEEEAHRNFKEVELKKSLGLEYLDNLLKTGEGLLTEVVMTEKDWNDAESTLPHKHNGRKIGRRSRRTKLRKAIAAGTYLSFYYV